MEVIEAIVGQEDGSFNTTLMDFIDAELTTEEIFEVSERMENFFLTVDDARRKWHGAAFNKLNKEDKKKYQEKYNLTKSTIYEWAQTVELWFNSGSPAGRTLPFGRYSDANSLYKIAPEEAEKIIEEAKDTDMSRADLRNKCIVARQGIIIEVKAQKIKKDNKGMKIEVAREEAESLDKSKRKKAADSAKKKAYTKAKEKVAEYESSKKQPATITENSTMDILEALKIFGFNSWVNNIEAWAIKAIYNYLAKENHPDKGGDVGKMSKISDAYSVIKSSNVI